MLLNVDDENQTHGVSNGGDSSGNISSTDSHFDDYDDVEYEDESDEYNGGGGGGIISHKYGNSLRPRPYNSPYTPVYCMYNTLTHQFTFKLCERKLFSQQKIMHSDFCLKTKFKISKISSIGDLCHL